MEPIAKTPARFPAGLGLGAGSIGEADPPGRPSDAPAGLGFVLAARRLGQGQGRGPIDAGAWERLGLAPSHKQSLSSQQVATFNALFAIAPAHSGPAMLTCRTAEGLLFCVTGFDPGIAPSRLVRLTAALVDAGLPHDTAQRLLAAMEDLFSDARDVDTLRDAAAKLQRDGPLLVHKKSLSSHLSHLHHGLADRPMRVEGLLRTLECAEAALATDEVCLDQFVTLLSRCELGPWLRLAPQPKFRLVKVMLQWLDRHGLPIALETNGALCETSHQAFERHRHARVIQAMVRLLQEHEAAPPELRFALAGLLRGREAGPCQNHEIAIEYASAGALVELDEPMANEFARLVCIDATGQMLDACLQWIEGCLKAPDAVTLALVAAALRWIESRLQGAHRSLQDRLKIFKERHRNDMALKSPALPREVGDALATLVCGEAILRLRAILDSGQLLREAKAPVHELLPALPLTPEGLLAGHGLLSVLTYGRDVSEAYGEALDTCLQNCNSADKLLEAHLGTAAVLDWILPLAAHDYYEILLLCRARQVRVATALLCLKRGLQLEDRAGDINTQLARFVRTENLSITDQLLQLKRAGAPTQVRRAMENEVARVEQEFGDLR